MSILAGPNLEPFLLATVAMRLMRRLVESGGLVVGF